MPPSLLESQLATLETPAPDERAWMIDIANAPDAIVADLLMRATARSPE
jgi:gluconate kinase